MITAFFYFLAALLIVLSRLAGRKWHIEYFIGGLIFGIYNELAFEFCWDYDKALGPMVWRDVPIIIIAGWGILTMFSLSISNRICGAWRVFERPWARALIDIIIFTSIGYPNEVLLSSLGYWRYTNMLHAATAVQVLGYVGVGGIVSSLARVLELYLANIRAGKKMIMDDIDDARQEN